MRGLSILYGVMLALLGAPAFAALPGPVKVETGQLSGVPANDPAITVFKGVPYAAPPVGELRWRAPAAPAAWTGVRKADAFSAICPQTPAPGFTLSEDCLTLNVWTGASAATEKRPVLVWLHVFLNDFGNSPRFDGEAMAKKGVIVVTMNYRIGPIGFLATPALSKESGHNASGNYGVMDQIAALKWVQKNIAAFGGDPARVTVAGMSSQRGSSVSYLAASPQAKGLFQRGISESQFPLPSVLDPPRTGLPSTSLASTEAAGQKFVDTLGAKSLAELRALQWEKVMAGADAPATAAAPRVVWQPIADGYVVPKHYNDPTSTHSDLFYVVGNNLNEGGARTEAQIQQSLRQADQGPDPRGRAEPKLTLTAYQTWAKEKFGEKAPEFLRLYPATSDLEAARQNSAVVQDYARVSTYLWSAQWAKTSTKPMFTYFWTHGAPNRNGGSGGAGHGSEIAYWFNNPGDAPWTDADHKIADTMASYWANIAKTGDPNGPGLPAWPKFDAANPQVMELGEHFASMPVASAEKLAFWKPVYAASVK